MALVLASGCFAYYLYCNQNSLLFNGLRVYTYIEEGYNNLKQYLKYDKNINNLNINNQSITEIIKGDRSYFLIGKYEGDLEHKLNNVNKFLNPILAANLVISENDDTLQEINLTEYINGFLYFNDNLDLSKNNNDFWIELLKAKKLINFEIEKKNLDLKWDIIDDSGNLRSGSLLIIFKKNDLKIETQ
jgi:hypothetical protein